MSRGNTTKSLSLSKLPKAWKKLDNKDAILESKAVVGFDNVESKLKQERANKMASRWGKIPSKKSCKDSIKPAELKEERNVIYDIYDICCEIDCEIDSHITSYCVSSSPTLPVTRACDDHDVKLFVGRKNLDYCKPKRQPYNYGDKNKTPMCFYGRNRIISSRKVHKIAFRNKIYRSRKKQLTLDRETGRRTKVKHFGIVSEPAETFGLEYEFVYLNNKSTGDKENTGGSEEKSKSDSSSDSDSTSAAFALCEENAPGDLPLEMLDFLLELQDHEVTPEDYEHLLQLDESVQTKTIADEQVSKLETYTALESHIEKTCGICLENYVVGDIRMLLPCAHVFHANCIDICIDNAR